MKHKTRWTLIIWMMICSLFELPLTWGVTESVLAESVTKGYGSLMVIVVVDLYIIAALVALVLAKQGVETIDNIRIKNEKEEEE